MEDKMVKKIFLIKMPVILLVFGMTFISCTNKADKALNGTWVTEGFEMTLKNGKFEEYLDGVSWRKGTYTANNGEIITAPTHLFGRGFNKLFGVTEEESGIEPKWYAINDFAGVFKSALIKMGFSESEAEQEADVFVNTMNSANKTATYNVNGNILNLTNDEVTVSLTRKGT